MQNVSVAETLASVQQVQRRARAATWGSTWLLLAAVGLDVIVLGVALLSENPWPWRVARYVLVLPLFVLGLRVRNQNRARLGLKTGLLLSLPSTAPTVPFVLGSLLIVLTHPGFGHHLLFQPLPAPLSLAGTALLVAAVAWVAVHERSLVIGIGAAVWTVAAAIAWIETPASYAGLMGIAMGLAFVLIALVFWRRLPVPPGAGLDPADGGPAATGGQTG